MAAGLGKRFGLGNKILAKINGKTVIENILDRLIQIDSNKNNIVVIGGNNYNSLKKKLNKYDVKLFYNKNYKNGLGSSVSFIFKKKFLTLHCLFVYFFYKCILAHAPLCARIVCSFLIIYFDVLI